MEAMLLGIVQKINGYLSDYVLIVLLVSAGLYFSIRTRFVQVRCFGEGMRRVFGSISTAESSTAAFRPSRRWPRPLPRR